jgi:hypothetical protein
VCTPSTYFCSGGNVHLCSSSGLSSTLYSTCTSTQYCQDAQCKDQVCTPNQPVCNGKIATTCNTDGSGYVSGGTDCGTQYCVGAACSDTVLIENFEDGDYNGWTTAGSYSVQAVTNTTAANGTAWSLRQTSSAFNWEGVYRTLPAVSPATISWWARAAQVNAMSTVLALHATTSTTTYLAIHTFDSNGQMMLQCATTITQPYAANTWYHVELRNINWTSRKFDYYVDGVASGIGLSFASTGSSLSRIDLWNPSNGATGYWDEIELK